MRTAFSLFNRLVLTLTSACALIWAGAVLIYPDNSTRLNRIASRIMIGDTFAPTSMPSRSELDRAELTKPCNALEVRSATIVRLRLYDEAIEQADLKMADERMMRLESSVARALQCVPTEPFLWFVRYWIRLRQGEPASTQLDNLAMSYRLGPHEGWIALRRNVYALAVYEALPDELKPAVRREFADLVNAGLLRQAADNLKGAGWPLRDVLLPELSGTNLVARQYFARMLRAEAIDVDIPGIDRRDGPLWR